VVGRICGKGIAHVLSLEWKRVRVTVMVRVCDDGICELDEWNENSVKESAHGRG